MNTKISASLFFCFSAFFTTHGMLHNGKEKDTRASNKRRSVKLNAPWEQTKDGVWVYDSASKYYTETNRLPYAKTVVATASGISTR